MCDEVQLERWARKRMTRRRFGALGTAGLVAACTSMGEGANGGLTESAVAVATAHGTMDGFFVHPAQGKHPGILFWPDIAGIREAKRAMARRLAGEGYAVLVVNQYYRTGPAPFWEDFADFLAHGGFARASEMRAALTPEAIMSDAEAATGWLDRQGAVDTMRGIGTQGYCMGGPFAVYSAAGVPSRIRAAASFHGGGLVREGETSPHRLFDKAQAAFLIAVARDDDSKAPEDKRHLREAADAAGVPAEIEVYQGDHGWTVPDAPAYSEAPAERAFAQLLALYRRAL